MKIFSLIITLCFTSLVLAASKPIELICIAGGSASGKTTFAKELERRLGARAVLLEFDRYFIEFKGSSEELIAFNWDHPSALKWFTVERDLTELLNGRPTKVPYVNFTTFERINHAHTLYPKDIIIFEGIHVLHHPHIRALCSRKIFVDAPEELRLKRRIKRDALERNLTPEQTLQMFTNSVKPMHNQYIQPVADLDDVKVVNQENIESYLEELVLALNRRFETRVP
jgi:uridine kinase